MAVSGHPLTLMVPLDDHGYLANTPSLMLAVLSQLARPHAAVGHLAHAPHKSPAPTPPIFSLLSFSPPRAHALSLINFCTIALPHSFSALAVRSQPRALEVSALQAGAIFSFSSSSLSLLYVVCPPHSRRDCHSPPTSPRAYAPRVRRSRAFGRCCCCCCCREGTNLWWGNSVHGWPKTF